MKKSSLLLTGCLIIALLLSGCSGTGDTVQGEQGNSTVQNTQADAAAVQNTAADSAEDNSVLADTAAAGTSGSSPAEFSEPVLEWWELYNPNGFDTLTAALYNPNDAAIDVSYDLVYYKNGEEAARSEGFFNCDILPKHKDIIWANYDIPKSTDADEIKLENVTVSEAYYEPVDGKYEYVGTTDGEAYFDFEFESKPTLATITFLLYSDNNNNGQFDKGEIVVTSSASLMEQTGRVSFETDVYSYTDYEVFFTAY